MLLFPIIVTILIAVLAYRRFGEDQMRVIAIWSILPLWTSVICMMLYDWFWWEYIF